MKRSKSLIGILIVGWALLSGCAAPEADLGPEVDLAAEAQAVRDRSAEWLGYAQNKESATLAENLFLPDAETMFDGKHLVGRDAILANLEAETAKNPDGVVDWTTTGVEVAASGDLAIERGSWTFDADGDGEAGVETGQYMTVWKKVDGTWWCAYDSGTTIRNEEAAPAE